MTGDWHESTVHVVIEPGMTYRFSCGEDEFDVVGRDLYDAVRHYVSDLKMGVIWKQDRKPSRRRA